MNCPRCQIPVSFVPLFERYVCTCGFNVDTLVRIDYKSAADNIKKILSGVTGKIPAGTAPVGYHMDEYGNAVPDTLDSLKARIDTKLEMWREELEERQFQQKQQEWLRKMMGGKKTNP